MNSTALKWFACGAVLASAAWITLYPRPTEQAPSEVTEAPIVIPKWSADSLQSALRDLESSKTSAEKLAAVNRLNEIPTEEIPAALASIETVKNRQLTFAAKTLLMRWASKDGPAAVSWAWQNLGKSQAWNEAFVEIGPAWAWRDPEGFGTWLKAAMERHKPDLSVPSETAKASEDPVFDTTQISKAVRWLVPGKPSLAFEILKARPGWSSDDHKIVDMLRTVAQVREALLAFDDIDRIDITKPSTDLSIPISLLQRWKDLDPEDFARSPHRNAIGATRFEEVDGMVSSWKSKAPSERASAANGVIDGTTDQNRPYTLTKIAAEWAADDPEGAAAWLESLPIIHEKIRDQVYATEISLANPGPAFRHIAALPPVRYQSSMKTAFDAWRTKRPGQFPDMSEWSETQRRDWADLEAIAAK